MCLSCIWVSGCAMFHADEATIAGVAPGDAKKAARANAKGVELVEAGRFEPAIRAFHDAIAADPSCGAARNNLGLVYFETGDLYSAATEFETASQLLPDQADPYGNLGLSLEAGGRIEEAIAMFETAHSIDPINPVYLGNLIRARMRRGDSDDTVRIQLKELLFVETRPDWVEWTQDQLAFFMNPRIQAQSVSPEFDPDLSSMTNPNTFDDGPQLTVPGSQDVISSPYPTDMPSTGVPPSLDEGQNTSVPLPSTPRDHQGWQRTN